MICELSRSTIHGYFDGELDAVRALDFERHLGGCAECQRVLEQMEGLRVRLQQSQLFEPASPQLRARIHEQLALTGGATSGPRPLWQRWWLLPAFAALATAAVLMVAAFVTGSHRQEERVTAELLDAHVRSLQPGHLTDVQSTDQHTVKPWFDGKLDFVPPVGDYAERGFPLLGGRLDVLDGHDVAALVYSRRKHLVNLFVWPSRGGGANFADSGSRQGYNWIAWQSGEMRFCLISDVSFPDLREMKGLIHP